MDDVFELSLNVSKKAFKGARVFFRVLELHSAALEFKPWIYVIYWKMNVLTAAVDTWYVKEVQIILQYLVN